MKDYLDRGRQMVDSALQELMPPEGSRPAQLVAAMRYSLFAGGKRLRPVLVLAGAQIAGGDKRQALPAACAVELVHTYSLIHDDLPAMDDDDFRRGVPTCHRKFGDATAILAGDALLTLAFEVISDPDHGSPLDGGIRARMVAELAHAAGWKGMVGGQQEDIQSEGKDPDLPTLEYIHTHKTGAMIRCCAVLGGLSSGASEEVLEQLRAYGEKIGLAFQVVDDILDITSTTQELGKDKGSDAARGKLTYPALFGLDESRKRARDLIGDAKSAVTDLKDAEILTGIADYVLSRRL